MVEDNYEPGLVPKGIYYGTIISCEIAGSTRRRQSYYKCRVKLEQVERELFMTIAGDIKIRYCLLKLGLPDTETSARDNYKKLEDCQVKVRVEIDKHVEDPSCLFNVVQLLELIP